MRVRPGKKGRDKKKAKTEKTTKDKKEKDKTEVKGAKVPNEEWQKLKKEGSAKISGTCRFYNHSCGCTREGCSFKHVCWVCGGQHRWIDRHFTNKAL